MSAIVKTDLEANITSSHSLILELGCGPKKKPDRIGIDKLDFPSVDIVADLEEGLGFFPNNSVDQIHGKSVLEHVDNFEFIIKEMTRVLKVDGFAQVTVPHFSNPFYYSDYTHKRFFGLYTFHYFVSGRAPGYRREVPSFYSDVKMQILSQKLIFKSPFSLRKPFKKILGWVFNICTWAQEFYEENLCYICPCYAIEIIFKPENYQTNDDKYTEH